MVARQLELGVKPTTDVLVAFNKTMVIPQGRAEVTITIDGIKINLGFPIVPAHSLSFDILVGRDIFKTLHLRAVSSAAGTTLKIREKSVKPKGFAVNQVQ